jgi:hypothetical protein
MSPDKQQEPRVIESIDVPGDGMKWVKLRRINWEDQTGRKVRSEPLHANVWCLFLWC